MVLSHTVGIASPKKDMFYSFLLSNVVVPSERLLIVASDHNGPAGIDHGAFTVTNTSFKKPAKKSQLIQHCSDKSSTHIDYILLKLSNITFVSM